MTLLHDDGHAVSLKVAGRGEPGYVDSLCRRWPRPNVEYVGFARPSDFFSSVDIAVFPSESYEALGNVVFEAYSQALPVVATACGGPAETVHVGQTGFLVPPGDAASLADRMAYLCEHPETRTAMSRMALHRAGDFLLSQRVADYVSAIEGFSGVAA